jgi:hypothetical protein
MWLQMLKTRDTGVVVCFEAEVVGKELRSDWAQPPDCTPNNLFEGCGHGSAQMHSDNAIAQSETPSSHAFDETSLNSS